MKPLPVLLPDGHVWLRAADPAWADPLDPSYARDRGGRWNPPGSFPALYLNGDVATARMQIERMLAGSPVTVDDLDDEAYVLVAATLLGAQTCADATSQEGLRSLGLPDTYPRDSDGDEIDHHVGQPIGGQVHDAGLDAVWCRSACTADGRGRELAWFPSNRDAAARAVWSEPLPYGAWRYAGGWGISAWGSSPTLHPSLSRRHCRRRPERHGGQPSASTLLRSQRGHSPPNGRHRGTGELKTWGTEGQRAPAKPPRLHRSAERVRGAGPLCKRFPPAVGSPLLHASSEDSNPAGR